MKRIPVVVAPVLLASMLAWSVPARAAAANKTARGTVTAVAADSVSIKVEGTEMKFSVDSKTKVGATGGSTKTTATKAGQPGVKLADLIKAGGSVQVIYSEAGGQMTAVSIRTVTRCPPDCAK